MNKRLSILLFSFLNIILPLLLGGMIYVLFRQKTLVMFSWFQAVGIFPMVELARNNLSGMSQNIWPLVLFSLPDALWVYSFCSLIALVWKGSRRIILSLSATVILASLLIEVLQTTRFVPGTFDTLDIVLIFLFGLMSIAISTIFLKQRSSSCLRIT